METFLQQLITGLANGGIYAALALALVMVYHATDHLNFAQGEMAMFSTYISLYLIDAGVAYWIAFLITLALSFVGGVIIERVVVRPTHGAPVLNAVIVFIGLLVIFNSLANWIFTPDVRAFPSPFSEKPLQLGGVYFSAHDIGSILVTMGVLVMLALFFRFTPLGLAMRAAAENPVSSRLVGIRVGWMLAIGWGLAAMIGAVAGMMVAPVLFLDPNMMGGVLIYAFAGALVGGISSPGGAVLGGLFVGVAENMAGTYIPFIGNELKLTVALSIIIVVLVVKPSGMFGKVTVSRV
ncbi:MAG: branched-chain amino acid ABC transporter permease [SAR324 cluster bacterium]|nr:branched-chain amino acid ABC transporter permease [SAR324 cluster bacterium]